MSQWTPRSFTWSTVLFLCHNPLFSEKYTKPSCLLAWLSIHFHQWTAIHKRKILGRTAIQLRTQTETSDAGISRCKHDSTSFAKHAKALESWNAQTANQSVARSVSLLPERSDFDATNAESHSRQPKHLVQCVCRWIRPSQSFIIFWKECLYGRLPG